MQSPRTLQLPLFPLNAVLCPGVALPLHIFEPRYRLMVSRCLDRDEPFGVVLLRAGRETGPFRGRLADVGTTALIREAGRYPDGRMDIVTVGGTRFRLHGIDETEEPYLVGRVTLLDEPLGDEEQATRLARRVSERFLRYLELLQPALDGDGPEIEVEIEVDTEADAGADVDEDADESDDDGEQVAEPGLTVESARTDAERLEVLMAAARRLAAPDDPTVLSYILGGLVQVELTNRQGLLEAPDTASRLVRLDALITREIDFLGRSLKPLVVDARASALRRN